MYLVSIGNPIKIFTIFPSPHLPTLATLATLATLPDSRLPD
ncbi:MULTISPECIES: hypothetical protein [Moorena]|nr:MULTISPECIES: hypothetical protein [Moorena]